MSMYRDESMPLYRQIAALIRRQINTGALPPGSLLPSEKFMADEHDVGRHTVRDALALLSNEGLLDCRRGHRARVPIPAARIALTLQPGEEITARMPTVEEAARLRLRAGDPVLEVRHDGQVQCYPASRTKVRGASPDDWTDLDLPR
jgi:GntR family transcriptional regulator